MVRKFFLLEIYLQDYILEKECNPIIGYISYVFLEINHHYGLVKAFESQEEINCLDQAESFLNELIEYFESNDLSFINGFRLVNLDGGDLGRA